MFSNLVESGSHAADLKRKGSFFVATLAFYGLLLVVTGVGSIYAYNASLDDGRDELELVALMKFQPAQEVSEEPQRQPERRAAAANAGPVQRVMVKEHIVDHPNPPSRDVAKTDAPVLPPGRRFEIGPQNVVPTNFSGFNTGPGSPDGTSERGTNQPLVKDTTEAPTFRPSPTPAPPKRPEGPVRLPSHVISGKTIEKPAPPYPHMAKQIRVQGPVTVQIVVDEGGRVISAKATSGHAILQAAAVQAAYRARFEPTLLSGQPVKVTGVITYNFVLQ